MVHGLYIRWTRYQKDPFPRRLRNRPALPNFQVQIRKTQIHAFLIAPTVPGCSELQRKRSGKASPASRTTRRCSRNGTATTCRLVWATWTNWASTCSSRCSCTIRSSGSPPNASLNTLTSRTSTPTSNRTCLSSKRRRNRAFEVSFFFLCGCCTCWFVFIFCRLKLGRFLPCFFMYLFRWRSF